MIGAVRPARWTFRIEYAVLLGRHRGAAEARSSKGQRPMFQKFGQVAMSAGVCRFLLSVLALNRFSHLITYQEMKREYGVQY